MPSHVLPARSIAGYTKAIVAIIAAVLVVLGAALTDQTVTQLELVQIAIAFVTAIGVYLVPNLDAGPARYAKGGVAFVGAALAVLVTVLSDGVTYSEWVTVVLAGLGAIGVTVLPNATRIRILPATEGAPTARRPFTE